MISLYDKLVAGVGLTFVSGRDAEVDLFRASLYTSALQLSNVMSAWYIYGAISGASLDVSRSFGVSVAAAILTLNLLYSSQRASAIRSLWVDSSQVASIRKLALLYAAASVSSFAGAAAALYVSRN